MNKPSRAIQVAVFTTLVLACTWFIHTTSARSQNAPLEVPQGDARADVPLVGAVQLGALPLYLERTGSADAASADAATVTAWAQTLELPLARQLSPAQFGFELALTAPGADTTEALPLQLVVDYSQIPLEYGGSFADRLTLYRVSDCALQESFSQTQATLPGEEPPPEALHCAEWEPLAVRNDRAGRRLVAELTLPLWAMPAATDAAAADAAPAATLAGVAALAGGPSYYVLSTLAAGVQGDYSYTPLANVSDYQVDLNSGAMTTGYTIPVPPPRGGSAPEVSLSYNSGTVDGMHSSRNNQPGSIGIGWSLQSGAIVRHLKPCNVAQAPGDLCLTGDNYSIVLNGVSSRLVKETGNRYRLQSDPHWLVEKFTNGGAGHPDAQQEYWVVTTPDGIRYRFGGEFVPETNADQNSVFYVTIYDTNPASCGNFLYDLCDKAWQWNLDRIEDTNGNVSNYFYELETNYYKARNDSREAFRKLYVRAGQLARIEYTTAAGQVEQPHARVLFNLELRCTNPTAGGACSWPTDFPDTPGDLQCNAYPASCSQNRPTFWSQRRTGSIQTQIYDEPAGRWEMVAHYNLEQGFPEPPLDGQGDSSERKLWLGSIAQHPGGDFGYWAFIQLEAENYNVQSGIATEPALDVGQSRNVTSADDGDYIVFEQVNFDNGATDLAARVASIYSGRSIEFRLDGPTGTLIATVNVPNTGGWQSWTTVSTTVSGATGIHDLYLVFKNSGMNINWFRFSPHFSSGGPLPGLPAVQYEYEMLPNRRSYDVSGVSPMYMARIDQITTELGGVVGVTYGQSHPCPVSPSSTIRMPYDCFAAWDSGDPNVTWDDGWVLWHKWKVTQMQLSDAFSGNPAQTTTYSYSAPTWHYSDDPTLPEVNACGSGGLPYPCNTKHWNDFRGSEVVTVTDSSGAQSEYRFHRGMDGDRLGISGGSFSAVTALSDSSTRTDSNWLRGQTVEMRRLDASAGPLSRAVNWFTAVNTAGSGINGAYFVALEKNEESLYGAASQTTRAEYQYDSYGNVTREIYHGDLATTADDRNIQRSYAQNTTIHLLDRIRWEKLWAGTGDGGPGEEHSFTLYGYDNTDPWSGTPTQGNLTELREYWTADNYARTAYSYNSRGVVATVTNANDHTTTTQFHSFYGYAVQVTNPLSHTVTTEMDPGWGVVTKVTDANGKVTEIEYDEYGRLAQVWLPSEPTGGPASLAYAYAPEARPAHVQSRQLFDAGTSSYLDSWTYVDGFGREIQSQRPVETGGQRALTSAQYDNLGRLAFRSEAYEVSGTAGSGYLQPTWSNLDSYHQFSYDELGNQTLDELLSGGNTLWSVSDTFDVWTQMHLDANGRQTDYHYDAFGQLAQVVEYNDEGGGPVQYTTHYEYNLRGDLVEVTDHANNVTTMSYDKLGRKTGMSDPDMGDWQYQYDPAGNLTAQQDGRGWWLYFTYDALDRLTAKRRDSANGSPAAAYSYDAGDIGYLDSSQAYDDSGATVEVEVQSVSRDERYQVTEKRWLVNGISVSGGSFRMAYGYNAAGQMTTIQYPADNNDGLGEVVQRDYDAVGRLESVVSQQDGTRFLDSVSYLATGQVAQLRLDENTDGATLDFTYQPGSLRLDEKKASGGGGSTFDLQHLTFAYDNGGNITNMVDARNGGQKQCFGYDWLDRLTSAFTGNADCSAYSGAGDGPYEHDYSYDPIGNITSFDGAGYSYSSSQPHAVTAAHGNSYGYDAAGNQTGRTIDSTAYTLVYDYDSRLTAVKEGDELLAEFTYDADGARVLKSDAGGLTVYLDGLYEYALPAVSETVMGEVGYINDALTHADTTIVLGRSYNNPVVFAQPISQDENDVAVVRITDIQADRFTLHVDEAPNHDGAHTTEAVSYIVLEAGSWQLPDGTLLEVGTVQTAATVGSALSDQWESVLFSQEFTVAPVVLSQVQTDNDPHWVKSRQQIAMTTGVNLALEEEEGKSTPHGAETVGWLAIEPGTGEWSGRLFEAALTPDAVTHSWYSFSFSQSFSAAPRFLAGLASYDSDESAQLRYRRAQLTAAGAQVRVEEDSVFDSEYGHTSETAAYLAIQGSGELSATGGTSGPASTTYYETQGGALAMRRAGYPADNGIFYILSDHLGSSSVILAQDGTVVKRDYYYPYGGNRGTPYTDVTTKRFTGQYHEAGLPGGEGLSFYNARWYDPQLGRFVSADSLVPEPSRPQGFNRYSYARGNPVRFSDPTGHVCYDPGMDAAFAGNCGGGSTPIVGSKTSQWSQPTNVVRKLVPASSFLQKFLNYMGINQKVFGIKVHSNASPTNPNLYRYEIGAWVLIQEQASFHPLSYRLSPENEEYFSLRGLYMAAVLLQVIQSKEEHYVEGGVDLFNWIQENPRSGQFAYPQDEIPHNQAIYNDYLIVAFLVDQKILPDFLVSYSSQPTAANPSGRPIYYGHYDEVAGLGEYANGRDSLSVSSWTWSQTDWLPSLADFFAVIGRND